MTGTPHTDVQALESSSTPAHIVVMGVAGVGKTTVAEALADRLGRVVRDADDFHPQSNIDKMASGHALTDEDRWPWLRTIVAWLDRERAENRPAVVTCSALRRAYRDVLRQAVGGVVFVHLTGPHELIAERMVARKGHFMPESLLASQFATLEPLDPDEAGITVDVTPPADVVVAHALEGLGLAGAAAEPSRVAG